MFSGIMLTSTLPVLKCPQGGSFLRGPFRLVLTVNRLVSVIVGLGGAGAASLVYGLTPTGLRSLVRGNPSAIFAHRSSERSDSSSKFRLNAATRPRTTCRDREIPLGSGLFQKVLSLPLNLI